MDVTFNELIQYELEDGAIPVKRQELSFSHHRE
jgi:hypothetical protein